MSTRPEYLVSFCLAQEGDVLAEIDAIRELVCRCDQSLQYWEIVYVLGEHYRSALEAKRERLGAVRNLRIVLVRDEITFYRRRAVAAAEAIGDVVVLTAFNELASADLMSFAADAIIANRIVLGRSEGARRRQPLSHRLLGLISRYRVDARDLKTIALPRDHLVAVLARRSATIDLRFEPKQGLHRYLRKPVELRSSGGERGLRQRLELLIEIISTSAARFLAVYALLSLLVCALAASYGLYAVLIILFMRDVQPGWFSTAIAQSASVSFLALGMALLALGVAHIVDRMEGDTSEVTIDEISNISFHDHVQDLNVETEFRMREISAQ
jgi:hypothetical protein